MLLACLSLSILADTFAVPTPPYRRTESVRVGEYVVGPYVLGNQGIFGVRDQIVSIDLATGKQRWKVRLDNGTNVGSFARHGATLLVGTDPLWRQSNSTLLAIDTAGGHVLWRMGKTGEGSEIGVVGHNAYTSLKPYSVSRIDLRTRKRLWTAALGIKDEGSMGKGKVEALACSSKQIAVNCDSTTYGIEAATGKIRWTVGKSYVFRQSFAKVGDIVLVPYDNGCVGRDLSTGRELWRLPKTSVSDYSGVFAGQFVVLSHGAVQSIDPKSGKANWSYRVGGSEMSGGDQYGSVIGDRLFARGFENAAIYDAKGTELWRGRSDEAVPKPIWTDGKSLVCFDGSRLLRYVHGERTAVPADTAGRRKLAREMVARFDELDKFEIEQLQSLGDDAFDAVLPALLKACHDYDAKKYDMGMRLYDRYHSLASVLSKVSSGKRTNDLIAAYKKSKPGDTERTILLGLLGRDGDESVVIPFFIEAMKQPTGSFELYESETYIARSYVAQSKHPLAVKYLIGLIGDTKADESGRFEAYVNLARTGGKEGLEAVLAARKKRTLLPALQDRLELDKARKDGPKSLTSVLAEKKDAAGRTWGLLKSPILGSAGDLWLAEKVGGRWKNAVFSGLTSSGISRWTKPAPPEPKLKGKTAKELRDGAWFQAMVGNADLTRDSDGDGLTDVVEARLGTDPKKADTDGDGDRDEIDPWPNAAPRPLSDAEQVIAAVMEARYHFDDDRAPAILTLPKGLKPFEAPGWAGPVIWRNPDAPDWTMRLEQCYEQGVAFISFAAGRSRDEKAPWEEQVIGWNGDHTEATTTISTYFGGLAGDGYTAVVRKFGDVWVVVAMRMAYVS